MKPLDALLLGILEGLTEFLPVSSTGHLVLLGNSLGQNDEAAKALSVVIQLGAVVAVVVYYRRLLSQLLRGCLRRDPDKLRLATALIVAFVPAAGIGFLFHKSIKEHLFAPFPIAIALIVGGVVMLFSGRFARDVSDQQQVDDITLKQALVVGLAQVLSLWPGMSRSMTTIVGGQLSGLRTATAAEFSFLLSVPVLGAATVYDFIKSRDVLLAAEGAGLTLAIGLIAAFAVALLVIAAFLRYLKRFGLVPFGVYRIALGLLVIALVN